MEEGATLQAVASLSGATAKDLEYLWLCVGPDIVIGRSETVKVPSIAVGTATLLLKCLIAHVCTYALSGCR